MGGTEKRGREKSIIVHFTTFRHRTMSYWSRANLIKLKLDLTKNKCKIFTKAIETVKSYNNANYVMVDINCFLKIVFNDRSGKILAS